MILVGITFLTALTGGRKLPPRDSGFLFSKLTFGDKNVTFMYKYKLDLMYSSYSDYILTREEFFIIKFSIILSSKSTCYHSL